MTTVFSNKIANFNIQGATIFKIFASEVSKLYVVADVRCFDGIYQTRHVNKNSSLVTI
jgi:hypothetical protein